MKINYILNHYSPAATTHFAHVLNLLREIQSRGCEINLFIEKAPCGAPEIDGINVEVLHLRKPFLRHLELMFRLGRATTQGYHSTFIRISAAATIAASLVHMILGGRAFLWQSGATHEFDNNRPWSISKLKWWLSSAMPNKIARALCQRFVTGPEAMIDYYDHVVGVNRKKIRLLYNDIDLSNWRTDCDKSIPDFQMRFGVQRPSNVILLVHRMSPVRRTLMYLEHLLDRLEDSFGRDWILLVAGDGSEREQAEQLVASKGLTSCCIFLGAIANTQLPDIYRLADLFINPSHAEGFPRVLIEAMACGLPIVTTDAGGTMDLVGKEQSEWVVDKNDPDMFATKTVEILENKTAMQRVSDENLNSVARYSTSAVAGMYIRVMGEK